MAKCHVCVYIIGCFIKGNVHSPGTWVPMSRGLCRIYRHLPSSHCLPAADKWLEAEGRAGERGCAVSVVGEPRKWACCVFRNSSLREYSLSTNMPLCEGRVVGATKEAGMLENPT